MAGTITKAGTGYGATLLISSTVATTGSPAPAPPTSPSKWLTGSPAATLTLTNNGTTGYTSATALPTTTNGAGTGLTITIVGAVGAITSGTMVAAGIGYRVGDKVYPTQGPSDGTAYFLVATVSGSVQGIPILQLKSPTFPKQVLSYDDITTTSSPQIGAVTVKENLATMMDLGEFTAEGVFLPSDPGLLAIQAAFMLSVPAQFQVWLQQLPGQSTSGNVYCFNAYIGTNPLPSGVTPEKAILWTVSLKLTSIVTVTVGS
jgi:hypothetical protein